MKAIAANLLAFNVGWLICVLAGAHGLPWLGTLTALVLVARHLSVATEPRKELALVLVAGGIGAVWDSLLVYAGLLEYTSGTLVAGTAPHWIVAMWLMFATTINVSLRWLKHRLALAALLGAVAGPAAYFAGYRLGGVQIPEMALAMGALGCGWALLMPLLMAISARLDGMRAAPSRPALAVWNAHV